MAARLGVATILLAAVACTVGKGTVAPASETEGKRIAVIGAGFSGLTAACELRSKGYQVTLYDKFDQVGGRARTFEAGNLTFDMGPSWYWMPGIFEHVFQRYNRTVSEFYNLTLLDPAYRIELPGEETVDVPGTTEGLVELARARGGDEEAFRLKLLLDEAKVKFDKGVYEFIWKPMVSVTEMLDLDLMKAGLELDMFSGLAGHLRKYITDDLLMLILKWPVIFIGASPDEAAAMYSLMTYAGHARGTWYPDGGLSAPALALATMAQDMGVEVRLESEVTRFKFGPDGDSIVGVCVERGDGTTGCDPIDGVVSSADYHHVEQTLLPPHLRWYDAEFWNRQVMSPSTLLYYLGFDREMPRLLHHTFFFETDLDAHLKHVFADEAPGGEYATQPTFYLCTTSKTDPTVAPEGTEAVFALVPIHHRLNGSDTPEVRDAVLDLVIDRMQRRLDMQCGSSSGQQACASFDVRAALKYSRSYGPSDFTEESHSFRGNAFGLANTLMQSLVLKPTIDSRVPNMVFAGHLTNPGPGVPPSLVSGIQAVLVLEQKLAAAGGATRATARAEQAFGLVAAAAKTTLFWWIVYAVVGILAFRFLLVPALALIATIGLELILPSSKTTLAEKQLRFHSYFLATEYMYRHGKTYFGAATLMSAESFFNTAAMYSLFRVVDDFVDNDDARVRASELSDDGSRIDPARYQAGANARRAETDQFIAEFWACWEAATAEGAGPARSVADLYAFHPIMPAVMETSLRTGYDRTLFERFFNAMLMDTRDVTPLSPGDVSAMKNAGAIPTATPQGTSYAYLGNVCRTTDEILEYMDGSAAVIGDFMLPVLVPHPHNAGEVPKEIRLQRERALPHARALGNAFQITNFIRDIHEDTHIARQYIPTDMCARHGIVGAVTDVTAADASVKIVSYPLETKSDGSDLYSQQGFVSLLDEMLSMAEENYASADVGIAMLPTDGQDVIAVARHAYAAIHQKIREGGYKIYSTRYRVPFSDKLKIATKVVSGAHIARMAAVQLLASTVHLFIAAGRMIAAQSRRYLAPLLGMLAVYAATAMVSSSGAQLTYFEFHQVYTLPMIVLLAAAIALRVPSYARGDARDEGPIRHTFARALAINGESVLLRSHVFWTAVMCIIASLYTLPWDDYLVASGIWGYGEGRINPAWLVMHTPGEEVAFFSIQTIIVAAIWYLRFGCGATDPVKLLATPRLLPKADQEWLLAVRRVGYGVITALFFAGVTMLSGTFGEAGTYGGLILTWVSPVLMVQWVFGAEALVDHGRRVLEVIMYSTVSLSVLDSWAIGNGIWHISPAKTAPAWLAEALLGPNLPLEEATFFLLASTMCAGGLTLANIVTLKWRASGPQGSFLAACTAVVSWGCRRSPPTGSPATPRLDLATKATLALMPLAAVAHFPAEVGVLLRQLFLLAPLGLPSVDHADDAAIAGVANLRLLRLAHLLLSLPVWAGHLRRIHADRHASAVLWLAVGTLVFTYLEPMYALPTFLALGPLASALSPA